jgi:hypothetical protein
MMDPHGGEPIIHQSAFSYTGGSRVPQGENNHGRRNRTVEEENPKDFLGLS